MIRQAFFSSRFHYTFGTHQATIRVRPGDALSITCPDSDNVLSAGNVLSREQRQRASGTTLFEGNPLAGPIFVEGATPGDAVFVKIEAVHLDSALGRTGLAPSHGFLPNHLLLGSTGPEQPVVPRHMYQWQIDPTGGTARLDNVLGSESVMIPLRPFVGCIGVCPPGGQQISTLLSGVFGGNMDLPLVRPGATIELPVFHDGGLLLLGDIHAAQGDGEIIGGAIETAGRIDCTIGLRRGHTIEAPRVVDAEHMSAVGVDGDLRQAIQRAYAHLVQWLAEAGLNRFDAYNLVSQTGSLALGNLLAAPFPVAARVPLGVVPQSCKRIIEAKE